MAGLGILATILGLYQSKYFDFWFHREIFYEALDYGSSLEEVLNVSRKITAGEAERPAKTSKTEEYLAARAARGDAEKYHRALGKSPNVAPDPEDRLNV